MILDPEQRAREMAAANASRGSAVLAIVLDGVRNIIAGAQAGDPESKKAARHLLSLARELERVSSAIEVPPPPGGLQS